MESLAGYSSDDSSLSPDHVSNSSSPLQKLEGYSRGIEDLTKVEEIEDKVLKYKKEEPHLVISRETAQLPILSFSQEYSMNTKRSTTLFAYLPWEPSREILSKLRKAGDIAMRALKEDVMNFDQRFQCNSCISARSVYHGTFGHTNKRSFTNLHVSLFPNMQPPVYKIKQLKETVQRAVRLVPIPPNLTHSKEANALDRMLSDGKTSKKRALRFQIDEQLYLYKSTKSGSLFVGVGLSKFRDENRTEHAPQFDYLASVSRTIEEQANLLKVPFSWSQFNVVSRGSKGNIAGMYYHFTLVICELNPQGKRMDDAEYTKTKEMLAKIDMRELLMGVHLDVSHLEMRSPDKTYRISLM